MDDARLTLRRLAKSPGFTAVALITLALGIGVNTSMFSVLRTVALRTLPYAEADRLVHVYRTSEHAQNWPHSVANFLDLRAQQNVFASIAAVNRATFNLALPGEPAQRLRGYRVSSEFFPLLGIAPALGRVFTTDEDRPGQSRVAILSHRFWTTRFGGDPTIIGRDIRLDGESVTVIGVMPASFEDPLLWGQVDAWQPLAFSDEQRANRRSNFLRVIARLKPGISREQAETGLKTVWAQLVAAHNDVNAGTNLRLAPLNRGSQIDDGTLSWFILALAGLVLLIACANLANIQFARTAARAREHAIRAALGATRVRLMREILGESLLLGLAGGALGVLVALWCNELLGRHVFVPPAQHGITIPLDVRVLAFAAIVSTLTGVSFGLLPAWLAARAGVHDSLKQGSPAVTASRAQHRVRHALIVAEVTLAVVLLATASLFVNGLRRVAQRDPGWRIDGLLTASFAIQSPPTIDTAEKRTAYRVAFIQELTDKLSKLPGVERVAFGTGLPTYGMGTTSSFLIEGRPQPAPGAIPAAGFAVVTPDYFSALGLPMITGRDFTASDRNGASPVTIINETMARAFFPGESPVGKRIRHPDDPQWREIVGVVRDARSPVSLDLGDAGYQMYQPYAQNAVSSLELALRARGATETLAPAVRRVVAGLNPEQSMESVGLLRDELGDAMQNITLAGWMLSAFAALGLLLAALGLYAVIANAVVQRTREIGIRMALGAQVRDVLAFVLADGLRVALIGTVLGLAGALAMSRLLRSTVPALAELQPGPLASTVGLIIAVAAFACWLPARRAAKVDPLIALRAE